MFFSVVRPGTVLAYGCFVLGSGHAFFGPHRLPANSVVWWTIYRSVIVVFQASQDMRRRYFMALEPVWLRQSASTGPPPSPARTFPTRNGMCRIVVLSVRSSHSPFLLRRLPGMVYPDHKRMSLNIVTLNPNIIIPTMRDTHGNQ